MSYHTFNKLIRTFFNNFNQSKNKIIMKITEDQIQEAAEKDYQMQKKWDNGYDRRKGFKEDAKWAIKEMKRIHQEKSETNQSK